MGINIELYGNILSLLDIELFDTILTEKTEYAFARILSRNLNDIFLRHPGITRTIRHTTVCRKYCNNSTC